MLTGERGPGPHKAFRLLRSPWAAVPLLAAFAALAIGGVRNKSPTYDEPSHVTGGYSYWLTGDYRLNPENGNLAQRWLSLPVLLSRARFPALDQEKWTHPDTGGVNLAQEFFYDSGNDPDALLWHARLMTVVLGVALGWVVYRWSRRLFGWRGGLVSLALYCFCPTLQAHGALASMDVAAALFFSLAVAGVWAVLHRVTVWTLLGSTLAAGCLSLTKFSAPLLVPMAGLLVAVRLLRGGRLPVCWAGRTYQFRGRRRQALVFAGAALLQAVGVWVLIWACYGFRFTAFGEGPPGRFDREWSVVLDQPGVAAPVLRAARAHRLLPEAYLYGQAFVLRFSDRRAAYLNGQCSYTGWWYFFPYCWAVKTPLPVMGVLFLAVATLPLRAKRVGWRLARALYRTAPLWILLGVYGVAAMRSNLNLGIRHLLPIYPPLFILAGAAGGWFARPTWKVGVVLAVLLALQVRECLAIYPDPLAYFNQLVGGPANGYRHLVDNNLDWGQDLPALRDWLESHGLNRPDGPPVYFSYFGVARPPHYGIRARSVEEVLTREVTLAQPFPLRGGVYCVSATRRAGPNEEIFQRWTPEIEAGYRALLRRIDQVRAEKGEESQEWKERLRPVLVFMEYARLLAYLRRREPDESIHHSILVYRLGDADVQAAMTGPLRERN
jgi:hypothetical protein